MRTSLRTNGALALTAVAALGLAACGAGSKTASSTAAQVTCDVAKPSKPTTVNVLAYNCSAIDPFTNTMVSSCSKNDYTLKHEPIDFAGTGAEDDGDARGRPAAPTTSSRRTGS